MKPNIANCCGENERESTHAAHTDMQSLITMGKINIYFSSLTKVGCCSLGKLSTFSHKRLHSLRIGKRFPNSQLLSVAGIQRHTPLLCVLMLPHTPTFQAHERSRLNFLAQSDSWTVAAKRRKSSDKYIFFVLVRRLEFFNFRPKFYHCQGDLRQRLGQWARNL